MLSEIKVNKFRKKTRNTIANKTVAKEKKIKDKKQETGNKQHIVE